MKPSWRRIMLGMVVWAGAGVFFAPDACAVQEEGKWIERLCV